MEEMTTSPSPRRLKFAELASKRVNRAASAIESIGNLSNKSSYEWTEQDAKRILKELRRAVKEVEERFLGSGGRKGGSFTIEP
jgi:N-glycosylase/DNA lyase